MLGSQSIDIKLEENDSKYDKYEAVNFGYLAETQD
jgi:hypothetical protein